MNNKIKCEEVSVSETKDMNDKDIMNEILLSLKLLSDNYNIMITEMSNKKLYKKILMIYNEIKDKARECFDLSFINGWYVLETAEESKIDETLTKMKKVKKEL